MAPRSRRKTVVLSDDDDDHQPDIAEPQKSKSGKLKAVKKGSGSTSRTAKASSSGPSPQKSKGKTTADTSTPPKPAGKPIYSFFNVATQRQQASQPSASPDKLPILTEEVELIQDDTDDERQDRVPASTALSKGSSTALAMRKRKFGRTNSFEDDAVLPAPAASQKFRKASSGHKVSSFGVLNIDKRPWTEQFPPLDLSELAVHKRKVSDVRCWVEMAFRGRRQKVLVLKGAAGSGKTTTVQLLAKDLGIQLLEWKDSTVSEYTSDGYVSTAARFEEFVGRAGKSAGLTLASNGHQIQVESEGKNSSEDTRLQALLIEEFPNTFSKSSGTLQSFRSVLAQYVSGSVPIGSIPTPIIMVISETLLSTTTAAADSFTAHRLLGPELIANPFVNIIEFNPVAPTYLTKALENIVVKEARKSGRRRTPGPQVLKHLAEIGDIRSAVSSLEFLCLRGDEGDAWSSKVTFTKSKQSKTLPPLTKSEEQALKLITNRESSLGIFHSVGKVVYNKRIEPIQAGDLSHPPPWLPQHRRTKLPETNADSLIDELGTDTSTFIAALHENYPLSTSCSSSEESLDSMQGCMDSLSDADLLSLDRFSFGTRAFSGSATDSLRQDEMCFQVAVRGLLFNLPNPVHRSAAVSGNRADAHRMFYPASTKLWRKKEEIEGKLKLLISELANGANTTGVRQHTTNSEFQTGVESWKRNVPKPTSPTNDGLDVESQIQCSTEIKNEMLMERLPHMAQILSSPKASGNAQSLLDRINAISRISGGSPLAGDEDADGDDGEDVANGGEQWTTDRPDAEAGSAFRTLRKPVVSKKQKPVFEAMAIPVETRVEKLVLDDDDIVDD